MNRLMPVGIMALTVLGMETSVAANENTTESAGVSIVEVPVFVTDKHGAPVRDLAQGEFEVFEDGKKQQIDLFLPISLDAPPPVGPAPAAQPGPQPAEQPLYDARRHLFLVFDFTHNEPDGVRRMLNAAAGFVESDMGDRDIVSLWAVSSLGLELICNFTNDRGYLKETIERLRRGEVRRSNPHTTTLADLVIAIPRTRKDAEIDGGDWITAGQLAAAAEFEQDRRKVILLDELERLARVISEMPGRKFCLLFSQGFEMQSMIGASNPVDTSSGSASANPEVVFGAFLERAKRQPHVMVQLDRITQLFSTADCQLFAFDTSGLHSNPNLGMAESDSPMRLFSAGLDSLGVMAEQTGGECYPNMNDLRRPISLLVSRTSHYYLLGYRATQTTGADPKRFHRIEVRVRRDGVSVRHRPGYAAGPESTTDDPVSTLLRLAAVALYDLPGSSIAFTHAVYCAPGAAANEAIVGLAFELPGGQWKTRSGDLPLEFYVFVHDEAAQVRTFIRGEHLVPAADIATRVAQTGIRYTDMMILQTGRKYALRFVVRNKQDGSLGIATAELTPTYPVGVPIVADPIFPAGAPAGGAPAWLNIQGIDPKNPPARFLKGSTPHSPFVWDGKQFSPDLDPFRTGTRRPVLLRLYPGRKSFEPTDFTLTCEVLDAEGAVHAQRALQDQARARIVDDHLEYLAWIDAGILSPDSVSIRISVVDTVNGGKAEVSSRIPRSFSTKSSGPES